MTWTARDLVAQQLVRAGLTATSEQTRRLADYVDLLVHWGRRLNLVGRPEVGAVVERHLPDGLVAAVHLTPLLEPNAAVVDVGAGAGIPGLVLALLDPAREVHLVEPRARRCAFLRTAAHQAGVRARVHCVRLGQVALPPVGAALSRATWAPDEWLRRAAPLVPRGGLVAAYLTATAATPAPPPTLSVVRDVTYALGDGTPRRLLLYRSG